MIPIVLAFDIERSGAGLQHDTLALGAAVVDGQFQQLDSLFVPAYTPECVFEPRCRDEFWSKHLDVLESLRPPASNPPRSHESHQRAMAEQFQAFRKKWEIQSRERGTTLELVSDNKVFDGGFMNQLLGRYTSDMLIPYSASSPQQYGSFWETHSEQRGLLMAVDPTFRQSWGFTRRIAELYDVPAMPVGMSHNHNPAHDAYTIAFDHQVLLAIRDGRIKRRS